MIGVTYNKRNGLIRKKTILKNIRNFKIIILFSRESNDSLKKNKFLRRRLMFVQSIVYSLSFDLSKNFKNTNKNIIFHDTLYSLNIKIFKKIYFYTLLRR